MCFPSSALVHGQGVGNRGCGLVGLGVWWVWGLVGLGLGLGLVVAGVGVGVWVLGLWGWGVGGWVGEGRRGEMR